MDSPTPRGEGQDTDYFPFVSAFPSPFSSMHHKVLEAQAISVLTLHGTGTPCVLSPWRGHPNMAIGGSLDEE